MERQRDQDGNDADDDRAQTEAAQGRVGHEQHREHGQRERRPAEHHGARGGAGDGQDRFARPAAAVAFLAQAGDDEQRVVDAQREAHRDDHVQDEQVQRERLPDDRGDGQRDDDRDDRHQHRDRHAEQRPDHQQQDHECRRQPELQLTLAQIARGELLEVTIERVAARNVGREARAAVCALDARDQAGDPLVLRLGEDDGQHGGVTVGRNQALAARVQVGGDPPHRTAASDVRRDRAHARLEAGIRRDEGLGPHDDELIDRLLMG